MAKVTKILNKEEEENKKLKVAAYCRVSTDSAEQMESLEAQKKHYQTYIKSNPAWQYAGLYYDEGISGTKMEKRKQLLAMLDACERKEIDLVITKSISRFSRNTVDCLEMVRFLIEHGVYVYFEKEGINTLESSGELLITILSSQAQEESRNISENCHWGIVRQFENGIVRVNCKKFMGYTKDEDGNLVIVPEEAELVRRIFRLFLEGNSSYKITEMLEADGIRTVTGNAKWSASVIDKMLSNEKYMGDALLQKTYTVDFLTKKKVMNRGIVPQYYIEDDHDAIIPKELFYRVQEEKARRASIYRPGAKKKDDPVKGKYSSKFVLSDICICAECGQPYRRQVWSKYGVKKPVWRCDSRLKHGTKKCRHSPALSESTLHEAVMAAINSVVEDTGEFVEAFRENVIRIIGSYSANSEPTEYDGQIDSLQSQMMTLIEESARLDNADEEFDRKYREIADQIKELKKKKSKRIREIQLAESYEQRAQDVEGYMKKTSYLKREFDDDLVRRLLQSIRVINENKIEIQFKSGIVMKQDILCDD